MTARTPTPTAPTATRPAAPARSGRAARAPIAAAALGLAAALSPLAAAPASAQAPPPAQVRVDAARLERLEQRQRVTGELRASRRTLLAAEVDGRVVAIDVSAGEAIGADRVVARLDDTLAKLGVDEAAAAVLAQQALIEERSAEVAKAKLDLDRALKLLQTSTVGSQSDVDDKQATLAAADARLKRARAELTSAEVRRQLAEERLDDMTIEAPFAASVVRKLTEVGQWVRPGDAIAELVDLETIDAWLDVPERWLRRIDHPPTPAGGAAGGGAAGGDSRVSVEIEVPSLGLVRTAAGAEVVPSADPLSRLFPVRVRLANPDYRLKPGLRITALVPTGEEASVLTVHKDAVLRDDAGAFVYFAAGSVAAVARIEPLFAVGDRLAVRAANLPPGAFCVTEGNERLFPGRPLSAPELTAAAAGGAGGAGRAP